jgi:hypothetical protein
MAREYNVMPNIRRARVARNVGEMDLVLEGTESNLSRGIQSLREQGIAVEFVEGDSKE